MKLFAFGSLGICLALAACSGDDGAAGKDGVAGTPGKDGTGTGTPGGTSVNGVTPGQVFLARTASISISGSGTAWSKDKLPAVDFGDPGIKVDKVEVASPTALIVSITTSNAAKVGAHTVKVDEQAYVGFQVASPIEVTVTGKAAQGSLVLVTVKNKDVQNPFDTSSTGDGVFSAKQFTGIDAAILDNGKPSDRVAFRVADVQPYSASFSATIDVDAKVAKSDIVIASGDPKTPTAFVAPATLDVAASTAKAFTGAASTNPIGAAALTSTLFETTPATDTLYTLSIAAAAGAPTGSAPSTFLLPAPGHFADAAQGSATAPAVFVQEGTAKYFVVVEDLSGKSGYNFTLTNTGIAAGQALAEVEANNTSGGRAGRDHVSLPPQGREAGVEDGRGLDQDHRSRREEAPRPHVRRRRAGRHGRRDPRRRRHHRHRYVGGSGGLPAMGMAGSAMATVLVMSGMAAVLLGWLHGRPALRRFVAWRRPGAALLRRIVGLGLPVMGTFAVETGLFLAIGLLIGRLGPAPLAAHQIALSIVSVSFMVPLAIAQAANVRVGNRVGAGDLAGARRAGLVAIGLGAATEAAAAAVLLLAPGTLAGLYIDPALPANREALATAMTLIGIAAVFQVADGMQAVAAGALRGLGDTRVPFGLAAAGYWGLGFPVAWWLTGPMGVGAAGAWWGLAASLLAVAMALTLRFIRRSSRVLLLPQTP